MNRFDLPIHKNPLRTRGDVERALLQLLEPVRGRFTGGGAGLWLGGHAAHYGAGSARMEAFSRMLWGLAPLWAAGGGEEWLPLFRRGLANGTDPAHPAYWGRLSHYDQKVVETAAIAAALLLCGERMGFSPEEARNLHQWLAGADGLSLPQNNWLFFRVLIQAAFRRMGWAWNKGQLEEDLAKLDGWYLGEGWYCDGQPTQMDYYIPFGMHYYGLIYAWAMERDDPGRSRLFKERAARFAGDYLYWFEDGGRAVPFGRSLTYRFAQGAFFSALALAGVEAVPWGVMKSRVLGNLRDWLAQPIFDSGGLLTVGYAYPNLLMSENYNAPGSPYWALKAFACLALPEGHPFWAAEEAVPALEPLRAIPPARMLAARDESQVQLFPAGQRCANDMGHCGAKYEKLVYSSRFGFSVPRGEPLEAGAFDCCLAVCEAGTGRWRTQQGFEDFRLEAGRCWRRFSPLPGVEVEVTVVPDFPAHRREYTVTTDRPIDAADGGFAIPAEDGEGRACTPDMVEWGPCSVTARFPWGVSAIRCLSGVGEPVLVRAWPNTNVLHPLTCIPTIRLSLPPGTHRFTTLVTGAVPKA